MDSLNCLTDSNRVSKNVPIICTMTVALGLFSIGVLILSLTGLGFISTTGYVLGTTALILGLIGLTGLVLFFCFLLKKKKLKQSPLQQIEPSQKIKPRKFYLSQYVVNSIPIKESLRLADFLLEDTLEDIQTPEDKQLSLHLFEKLRHRVAGYLESHLISEEKIIGEGYPIWFVYKEGKLLEEFEFKMRQVVDYTLIHVTKVSGLYLRELIKKMEDGSFSEAICIDICENLLRVAPFCLSALVEICERLYYRYCLGTNDLERAFRSNLNEIKKNICESCLLTCSETQPGTRAIRDVLHLYNTVATSSVGKSWGLNSPSAATDGMGVEVSAASLEEISKRLEGLLNPELLINSMQSQISLTPYNVLYYDALVSLVQPEELQPNQNPEDFVAEHFYEDYLLNKEGVTRLLLSLGWLVNPIKQ